MAASEWVDMILLENPYGGLTAEEHAQLMAIQIGVPNVNVAQVNGIVVTGTGTEQDPWGP